MLTWQTAYNLLSITRKHNTHLYSTVLVYLIHLYIISYTEVRGYHAHITHSERQLEHYSLQTLVEFSPVLRETNLIIHVLSTVIPPLFCLDLLENIIKTLNLCVSL